MERKKEATKTANRAGGTDRSGIYDLETPLWHKYYERVRKTARFPRYYKKDLNW